MIARNLFIGIGLLVFGVGMVNAQGWSDDVQVGTHSDIINVELAFDHLNNTLFAVICWAGDGCTSYISSDYGDSWTESYSEGPGATVNDISCVYSHGYYYVALSTPVATVLYRFDAGTGDVVDFGGTTPYFIVTTQSVEKIILAAPGDEDVLYFVGSITTGQIFVSQLTVATLAWDWRWPGLYCDRGLDVVWYTTQSHELRAMISYISGDDYLNIVRYRWGASEYMFLSNHTEVGIYAEFTALAAATGEMGHLVGDTALFCCHDLQKSSTLAQLHIGYLPSSMGTYVEAAEFTTAPVMKAVQDYSVVLAYVQKEGTTPTAPTYGHFRLHDPYSPFSYFMSEPIETYTSRYVEPSVRPDLAYLWMYQNSWGVLFADKSNPAGNHAYFTRRLPSCCVGLTGNVDGDAGDMVDIGDLTALIGYLFIPPYIEPDCMDEANVDGEGTVDIGDLTALIGYLFIPPYTPPEPCQ